MSKEDLEKQIELLVKDDEISQQTIINQRQEIERLNNIIQKAIKKLENEIKYLEHLDKIGAMYSTEQNRFNNSLLQELKGSDKE